MVWQLHIHVHEHENQMTYIEYNTGRFKIIKADGRSYQARDQEPAERAPAANKRFLREN
jgi:hypothetical protein